MQANNIRIFVIIGVVALVLIAGFLAISSSSSSPTPTSTPTTEANAIDAEATLRQKFALELTETRNAEILTLVAMSASPSSEPSALPPTDTPIPSPMAMVVVVTATPAATSQVLIVVTELVVTATPEPPTAKRPTKEPTLDASQFLTRQELDSLLGAENWYCYPTRQNAVAGKQLPAGFKVQSPIFRIDSPLGTFETGQSLTGSAQTTVWLEKAVLRNQCPLWQLSDLAAWDEDLRLSTFRYTKEAIDDLIGTAEWSCLSQYAWGIAVRRFGGQPLVRYPMTSIDYSNNKSYGVGETVPGTGLGTVWFNADIPARECR